VLWCAYIVRDALLIIYVSGCSRSASARSCGHRAAEVLPIAKRLPRWLAILILYVAILGTLALVLPDLSAARRPGAGAVEQAPGDVRDGQQFLIRKGCSGSTSRCARRSSARRASGDAVARSSGASQRRRRHLRRRHDPDPDVLHAGRLVEPARAGAAAVPAEPRARVDAASREVTMKVSAWLGGQLLLGGSSARRRRSVCGRSGFRSSTCWRCCRRRRDDSDRRPILSAIPALAVAATCR
jgi:hypothetical protein